MEQPKEELLPMPEKLWEIKGTEIRELTLLARHPKNPRYAIYIDETVDMPVRIYLKHAQEELMYEPSLEAARKTLRGQLMRMLEDLPVFIERTDPIEVNLGPYQTKVEITFPKTDSPSFTVMDDANDVVGFVEAFTETTATISVPPGTKGTLRIFIC